MIKNINNNIFDDIHLNDLTLESFSCTHDNIAKLLHCLVKDNYIIFKKDYIDVCMYFDNKWNCVHLDGSGYPYEIIDNLYAHYKFVMTHYQSQLNNDIDETAKRCLYVTLRHVTKILQMLQSCAQKKCIISRLKIYYNQHEALQFYSKLDKNKNFLGFKNCVYDFDTKLFRQCLPTDMIMNICNYNYKPSSVEKQNTLKTILAQILDIHEEFASNKKNLNLFLNIILNMLRSQNTKDNCLIVHGKCISGKSTLHNLILTTFEDLSKQIPSSKSTPNIRKLYSSELEYAKYRFMTTMHNKYETSGTIEDCVNFMFDAKNKLESQNMIIFSDDEPHLEKIYPSILEKTQIDIICLPNKFDNDTCRDINLHKKFVNLNCAFIDILISNF